jgi:hypothetical protein
VESIAESSVHPRVTVVVADLTFHRWDQGLLDMCPGEKRTLTVPPEYGYGQRSIGSIPAGSTLSTSANHLRLLSILDACYYQDYGYVTNLRLTSL